MFQLINSTHQEEIVKLAAKANRTTVKEFAKALEKLIEQIRAAIPEKKRISYGRYSIIKKMGLELYPELKKTAIDVYIFACEIFDNPENDQFVRSLAVQLISIYGVEVEGLAKVLLVFEKAAADELWEIRECSAGFIRKLIKKYPVEMKKWYITQTESTNPLLRRFASESIRPVADNQWFHNNPEFCFAILEKLYTEPVAYPRTSVGNNLSDWARIDKERVYKIVEQLVKSGNKHSYWIAYRACRNLIKTAPLRVMDLLKVDEYKYKKRIHYRKDY